MRNFPLIKFVVAFSIGLILTSYLSLSITFQFILFGALLVVTIIFNFIKTEFTKYLASIALFVVVILTGMIYLSASNIDEPEYPFEELFVKDLLIDGRVEEIELPGDRLKFTINVERVLKNKKLVEMNFGVYCNLNYDEDVISKILERLRPGNRVVILGNLSVPPNIRNPGEFDYREYLRSQDITAILNSYSPLDFVIVDYEENFISTKIFEARYAVANQIKDIYSHETAGLLKGLLLADRSEIGYDVKEGFIKSGVIHVLAVSGLHVGFIVLILVFLLGRFNIYIRITFTILGLLLFMIITGMPPSVTRATIMAVLLLISYLRSNKQNNFNTLALAAMFILLFDPNQIFTPGFQLSFSAVISIFVYFPRFRNLIDTHLKSNRFVRYLLLFLSVSLAAQLGTIPFTIYYFGKLSLISLFSNIIIIPAIGFIISLGILTLIFSLISQVLASLFILTNELLVDFAYWIVKLISSFRFTYLSIPDYSIWDGAVYLLLLLVFTLLFRKLISIKSKLLFAILIGTNLVVWSQIDNKQLLLDGKLSVLFLDVGQSDAALVKFPNDKTAMINFGSATKNYSTGKATIIPLLNRFGIDKIDYGIISHLNRDKYLGILELIEKGMVDTLYIPKVYSPDIELKLFNNFLEDKEVVVNVVDKNRVYFNNSRIYLLSPIFESEYDYFNILNRSVPVKINYGNTNILFAGGIELRGERILTDAFNDFLNSDVFRIANYGSDISTGNEFLDKVKPEYAIISVGLGNYLDYPSKSVLKRLSDKKSQILRTDEEGALLFISDGDKFKKVNWRSY